jgi:serine/threonine protein kinase
MKCPSCGIENLEDSKFCRKCATALPGAEASFTRTLVRGAAEFASGTVIAGHYKIARILGRGGMGIVYLADDIRLKRPVALKFLPPGIALDEDIRRRFIIEAQAAAALSHSNIGTIYEVDDQAEKAFISMEYVEGKSLREKAAESPLPFDCVLDISLQVCAGLDEAHKKGIVHRDIKSTNIMITEKGQAKIMDFGLAKVAGTAMVMRGRTSGRWESCSMSWRAGRCRSKGTLNPRSSTISSTRSRSRSERSCPRSRKSSRGSSGGR